MRAAGTPVPQNTMLASAVHGWATRPSFRKSPQARAPAVQLGGFKLILSQIIGQTELLITLILGRGANKDLVVSRIGVDIVVFPISLHQCHFIWRERLERCCLHQKTLLSCRTQSGLEFSFVLVGERGLQDPAACSLELFEHLVRRGFSYQDE